MLKWPSNGRLPIGWIAIAAIALPPLLLGPWLPFSDLVAFVGLGAYPAKLSSGPLHFATFQFTYIVHYAISRVLLGLGVPVSAHVVLFYLLQAVALFVVLWRTCLKVLPDTAVRPVAIAFGALAFWDNQFLWGGPLPFSLGATALAVATLLTLREAEGGGDHGVAVPALSVLALLCHPFTLPFALLLHGLRFAFVRTRRRQGIAVAITLLLLGWVIRNDSPGAYEFRRFIVIEPAQIWTRLGNLFSMDPLIAEHLFGFVPPGLTLYFWALGLIHLAGFVVSPVVVVLARNAPALRLLTILDAAAGVMYFLTPGLEQVVPFWPQRILTLYSPFTFAGGIASVAFLVRRRWPEPKPLSLRWAQTAAVLPLVILALLVAVQWPILRLADDLDRNFRRVRAQILQTNVTNAYVLMTDVNRIQPVYLRSLTFLLFSDPQLVARNLIFDTEWHSQPRHPTRLAEHWVDLHRPRLVASFGLEKGAVSVHLERPRPDQFAIGNNNNSLGPVELAALEWSIGNELFAAGALEQALPHYRTAARLNPRAAGPQHNLALALYDLGRKAESVPEFEATIKIDPNYADPYRNLGVVLLELGRPEEAARNFEMALRLNPNDAVARTGLQRARPR